jgi:pimeloyl-ACP methyl ester carboxylesterase
MQKQSKAACSGCSNATVGTNKNRSVRFMLERPALIAVLTLLLPGGIRSQQQTAFKAPNVAIPRNSSIAGKSPDCSILYVGFVGALEPPDNKDSGVVQLRDLLRGTGYPDVCAESFSPYVWPTAVSWLLKHFPSQAIPSTPGQIFHAPKVILVGHSMGGWAALAVARELRAHDIPIELTIQVDSVGITDHTVPNNVKSAAIFHANDVLVWLTTKHLRAEDPAHTKIFSDVRVTGVGHESITRDPRIRQLVLDTIDSLRAAHATRVNSTARTTFPTP